MRAFRDLLRKIYASQLARRLFFLLLLIATIWMGVAWVNRRMLRGNFANFLFSTAFIPWIAVTAVTSIWLIRSGVTGVISSLSVGALVGGSLGVLSSCTCVLAPFFQPVLALCAIERFYGGDEIQAIKTMLYYGIGGDALIGAYIGLVVFLVLGLLAGDSPPPRRPSGNYCQVCGYNLTGNVSGVCPECGTPVRSRLP